MRNIRRWGSPALAIALLAVLVWRLGTGPFLDGVKALDARALLLVAVIFFFTTLASAWRWTIVSRGIGASLSLPSALAAYYRAVFLNLVLPAGVAGDVHRGVSHGREVHDVSRGVRGVVWERTAGQVVQVVLAIAVLLILPSPVRSAMPFVGVATVAILLGVVLVGRMRARDGRSRRSRMWNTMVSDLRSGVLGRRALPAIVLSSTLVFIGHAATFFVAARTVGVDAPTSNLLPLALLALLAMVLPSIGGWGPREGATAWVFATAGLGAGLGAATAVAYGVLVLAASLPGAVVLAAGWLPRRRFVGVGARRCAVFRPEGTVDA